MRSSFDHTSIFLSTFDKKYSNIQATVPGPGLVPEPGPKTNRDRDWDQSSGPEMAGTGTGTGPSTGTSPGTGPGPKTFSAKHPDYFNSPIQLLRPLFNCNYAPISVENQPHNLT